MRTRLILATLLLGLGACASRAEVSYDELLPDAAEPPIAAPAGEPAADQTPGNPPKNMHATSRIAVILYEGAGTVGNEVGCGDAVVWIERPAEVGSTPLEQALRTLLATPAEVSVEGTTYANALGDTSLLLESATVEGGVATIRLTGNLMMGGACDTPRVEAQIAYTVQQFPEIESSVVELNGSADAWDQLFSFKGI